MRIFRHYTHLPRSARGSVVALGNFDGVHRGHQAVISSAGAIASGSGVAHTVMTFEPHPRSVFQPQIQPFRLTPLRIKARCIEALGVDHLFVQHFDREFSRMEAEAFVTGVLCDGVAASHVVAGCDFVFGHGRKGDCDLLECMAAERGFDFTRVPQAVDGSGAAYSSTTVRELIAFGEPARAAVLLGRLFEIEGRVVPGDGRGRTLGFPTANVHFEDFLLPATGVYAVRAGIDLGPKTLWRDGVTNFGSRPTFGGGEKVLEVHLFGDCDDLGDDLRGRHLRVALAAYLRPEKTFDGAAQLQAQIADDIAAAKTALAELPGGGEAAEIPPSLAGAADGTT